MTIKSEISVVKNYKKIKNLTYKFICGPIHFIIFIFLSLDQHEEKIYIYIYIYTYKNYRGITLTSIAAKIYNTLLRNRIEPKIEKILRKNQNGFWRNLSTSQIMTIRQNLEAVRAKNLETTILFVDFSKPFDSIHRGKMEQILLAYGLSKETVAAIIML